MHAAFDDIGEIDIAIVGNGEAFEIIAGRDFLPAHAHPPVFLTCRRAARRWQCERPATSRRRSRFANERMVAAALALTPTSLRPAYKLRQTQKVAWHVRGFSENVDHRRCDHWRGPGWAHSRLSAG